MNGKVSRVLIACLMTATVLGLATSGFAANSVDKSIVKSIAKSVPEPLKPWIPWVNRHLDFLDCPIIEGGQHLNKNDRLCAWPGQLTLDISRTRGQFEQNWRMYQDSWVPLPGENMAWPLKVTVNGDNAIIQNNNGRPYIFLKQGSAKVFGYWKWDSQPQQLAVPNIVATVALTLNGSRVHFPKFQGDSLLLTERQTSKTQADSFELQVFRLVQDEHPILMQTKLQLVVSGAVREINLGQVLVNEFRPVAIESKIPAYFNAKQELIIQARPGQWDIDVDAFAVPALSRLTFNKTTEHWPTQEIWSFNANPEIRIAMLEQLPVIDPETSSVPHQWRQFPSFLYEQGATAVINEKIRGIPSDASNRMTLQRKLWLNFDGEKWRFEDEIKGSMRDQWRLSMAEPYQLQHAKEHQEPLLITRSESDQTGVEVRNPQLNVQGGGEIAPVYQLPVAGWQDSFEQVSWTLNLPPAYRLIKAQGAESSNGWIEQWNLWDIFWVMLLTVIAYRFGSPLLAIISFITLALMFHETGAPVASLSNLIIAYAIHKMLPVQHKVMQWIRSGYFILSVVIFVIFLGLFFIAQVRIMVHPQLEHYSPVASTHYSDSLSIKRRPSVQAEEMAAVASTMKVERKTATGSRMQRPSLDRYSKDTVIQTGSGKPEWQWNEYRINWGSPVTADQQVNLWIASPWFMILWRMLILAGLFMVVINIAKQSLQSLSKRFNWQSLKTASLMLLAFMVLPMTSKDVAAEIPDKPTLAELKQWVNPPAECSPECVTVSGVRILNQQTGSREQLTLEMQVDAFVDIAVAVPQSDNWAITSIKVNERPYNWLLQHQNKRWLKVNKGRSKVVLNGVLSGATSINLTFLEPPHNVQNLTDGWVIEGIKNGSLLSGEISLTKKAEAMANRSLTADSTENVLSGHQALSIPPMVRLVRQFWFDTEWRMVTRVERIAPTKGSINLTLPKLPFEHITTGGISVAENSVKFHMPAEASQVSWRSRLDKQPELTLAASNAEHYLEEWTINASHQWRVSISGVPEVWPVNKQSANWTFRYLPRSEEKLSIRISKPAPIEGYSQTFDNLKLSVTPGQQQRRIELNTRYRSSRGGQSVMEVGKGEQLNAMIDGEQEYLQIQDGAINYTTLPGEHQLVFDWKDPSDMSFRSVLPQINLHAPISNMLISWQIPQDRWLIWTQGPVIGPAIIYWGELLAFLLIAAAVWRFNLLPISPVSWLLLGLGLSTQSWGLLVMISLWFVALHWHKRLATKQSDTGFNVLQIMLAVFSVLVLIGLIASVPMSLLSQPDMGIVGNRSNNYLLNWYADAALSTTPEVVVYSLPMWVYKLLMLAWALWLSFALVKWSRWGWGCLNEHGFWRNSPTSKGGASKGASAVAANKAVDENVEKSETVEQTTGQNADGDDSNPDSPKQ